MPKTLRIAGSTVPAREVAEIMMDAGAGEVEVMRKDVGPFKEKALKTK